MVFDLLNHCHAHMTAYMKENIPERLHYRNNRRIQPIILIADEGWTILHNGNQLRRKSFLPVSLTQDSWLHNRKVCRCIILNNDNIQ